MSDTQIHALDLSFLPADFESEIRRQFKDSRIGHAGGVGGLMLPAEIEEALPKWAIDEIDRRHQLPGFYVFDRVPYHAPAEVTFDQFKTMTLTEKGRLYREKPDLYERLANAR